METIHKLYSQWFRHQGLVHHAGALRLGILHANFGTLEPMNESNSIPENRLFFALDHCGHVETEKPDGSSEVFELTPGSITFIQANVSLSFHFTTGRLVGIHFYLESFPGLDLLAQEMPRQISDDSDNTPLELYQLLHSEFSVGKMMQISARVMQTASLFATTAIEELNQQVTLRERYADLVHIMETHLDAQLTIDALAKQMRLTRDQLSKRFRKDLGETLKAYMSKMLIRRACELLSKGNNIKTTAQLLHFSDEFYFSKFFKKHTGNTPSEYIHAHQK